MALSDREMLILDCFMYSDIATRHAGSGQSNQPIAVKDAISKYMVDGKALTELIQQAVNSGELALSGDLPGHPEKLADVIQKMYDSPKLNQLVIEYTTPEVHGHIRAASFYDPQDNDVTVAFRGTGGSFQQWYNNFEGWAEYEQETQEEARKFIEGLPDTPPYDQIDVTGHSNGANQALYVTMVNGDKVRRCVAYEGQGISKTAYQDAVNRGLLPLDPERSKSIINISGKNDFVNTMLKPIGENRYVNSNSLIPGVVNHGSYGLLDANENRYDENGNLISGGFDENGNFREDAFVGQGWFWEKTHAFLDVLDELSDLPYVGSVLELFADFAGILVGLYFDRERFVESLENAYYKLKDSLKQFGTNLIIDTVRVLEWTTEAAENLIDAFVDAVTEIYHSCRDWLAEKLGISSGRQPNSNEIAVDTALLRQYAEQLGKINGRLGSLDRRMDSLYSRVGLFDLWKLLQADLLTRKSRTITKCVAYLNDTRAGFEQVEAELQKI